VLLPVQLLQTLLLHCSATVQYIQWLFKASSGWVDNCQPVCTQTCQCMHVLSTRPQPWLVMNAVQSRLMPLSPPS
jgi:hypothetical protein